MAQNTSAVTSSPSSLPAPKSRVKWVFWGIFVIAAAAVGVWGILNSPAMQERRLAQIPLDTLFKEREKRQHDPLALYVLGRKLNAVQRFPEADPILRRAAELDPDNPDIRDEWTQALLGSGLTTAAFQQLKQYQGSHPESPEAHFLLGKFYVAQRSMKRASEELEACVKHLPHKAEAWMYLALARDTLNEVPAAIEAARKAVEIEPDNARHALTLASLLARTNHKDARAYFEKAVRLESNDPTAKLEYARWLMDTSTTPADKQKAEQFAADAVKRTPDDAVALLVHGWALLLNGKNETARQELTQAAERAPLDPSAAKLLVQAYREAGQPAEAERWQAETMKRQKAAAVRSEVWEKLRVSPDNSALNRQMARLMAEEGNVDGTIRHHARALQSAIDGPPALIAAANDLTDCGFAREALPLAQRAVTIGNSNPAAFEAHGNALLALDQPEQAFKEYNKAVGWLPKRVPEIQKRIDAYYTHKATHPSEAETAYLKARQMLMSQVGPRRVTPEMTALIDKALSVEPKNRVYLNFLLQMQVAQRKTDDALTTADRILEIAPHDARTHTMKATLLAERAQTPEQFSEVRTHLNEAKSDPSVAATYHYAAGLLALQQNKPAEAAKELRATLEQDPDTDVTYFKLAQAERLNNNPQAADQAMAQYRQKQDQKRKESALLGDIAQKPNDLERYRKAVAYLRSQGKSMQAQAVAAEATRRFGTAAKL